MMPAAGTFDYVATIPEGIVDGGFECRAATPEPIDRTGDDLRDSRLVGLSPLIRVTDGRVIPGASPSWPWVLRSRITLTAPDRHQAAVAEVTFHVDKALTRALRSGDEVHIARTSVAGLGLSVVRDGQLVAAVGGVTAVRLGRHVVARTPGRLTGGPEAVSHERDPDSGLSQLPIEVVVGASRLILYRGHRKLDVYDVDVVHGFYVGIPGRQECCAIYDGRVCPEIAATASAMLMDDGHALSMRRW